MKVRVTPAKLRPRKFRNVEIRGGTGVTTRKENRGVASLGDATNPQNAETGIRVLRKTVIPDEYPRMRER